jgi:hypothetical protein
LEAAATAWPATCLPTTSDALARDVGLSHPLLSRLTGGPDRMVAGRLAKVVDPVGALDLIDDWIAA